MSAMPLHSVGQYSFSQRPETCILSAQHLSVFCFFFFEENCSGTVGGMKHLILLGRDAWLYAPCHSCLKIIKICYYVSILKGLPCLIVT